MLAILHKGNQISLDMDQTGFTGDVSKDTKLPVVTKMVAGRVAAVKPDGTATLADGNETTGGTVPVGFIINDAEGYFYENKPALASGKIAVTFGNCVVTTDQIDTSETFAPGDKLFVGTGSKVGLITKTAPSNSREFGIALSPASASSPNLTLAVLG